MGSRACQFRPEFRDVETHEAGNAGWKRTVFFPSFVRQSPPPTLDIAHKSESVSKIARDLPKVTAGEEDSSSACTKCSDEIADAGCVVLGHL